MKRSSLMLATIAGLSLAWVLPAAAQTPPPHQVTQAASGDTLLTQRVQDLEQRLRELEDLLNQQQAVSRREALRQRAGQRAREQAGSQRDAQTVTFTGYQRMLNALNPEISLTGDFISYYRSPSRPAGPQFPASSGQDINDWLGAFPSGNRFFLRGAELNVVAPLDPYTRGKFFFDVPADGSHGIEEAYMEWIHLPTNLNLKIGYFLNQFGQLNRWHEHALPQVDRPHVLTTFLSEEGLAGLGMSFNWVLGSLWSHVNEVHLEFISGGDGVSFNPAGRKDLVALARLKNYWDLSQDTYLEIGLSAAQGHNDTDGLYGTTLGAVDLNYKWVPAGRGHYRTFELRSEVYMSRRETPTGTVESLGAYASAQNRLSARLWTSFRLDYAQLPWDSDHNVKGAAVTLDYWQSEFVFFRLQLDRLERTFADSTTRLFLQTVWSMGPHKHEAY